MPKLRAEDLTTGEEVDADAFLAHLRGERTGSKRRRSIPRRSFHVTARLLAPPDPPQAAR
jgi:hypothetical protein